MTETAAVVPKKRGRPPKSLVDKKKNRGQVGRPKGDADAIKDFLGLPAFLLTSPIIC